MANVPLTKSTQTPSSVVLKSGGISDTGNLIYIHLDSSDWDFWTPVEETTGDGSVAPAWDNSEFLYCRFVLRGRMVAGTTLGILKLKDQSTKITMGINYGAADSFPGGSSDVQEVMIERVRIHHRVRAVNVGVVVTGYTTDTALTDIT